VRRLDGRGAAAELLPLIVHMRDTIQTEYTRSEKKLGVQAQPTYIEETHNNATA
jgi:hypothetical protein